MAQHLKVLTLESTELALESQGYRLPEWAVSLTSEPTFSPPVKWGVLPSSLEVRESHEKTMLFSLVSE